MDKSLIEQMTNESQHFSDDLKKTIKEVIRDSMNLEVLRKKLPQSAVDNLDPKALLAIVAYTEILYKFSELATQLRNKEEQGDE